jgi:hypothetical protein
LIFSCCYSEKAQLKKNLLKENSKIKGIWENTYTQGDDELDRYAGNCYMKYNNTIFNLNPLSDFGSFYTKTISGEKVELNICNNIISECNVTDRSQALIVSSKGSKKCKRFSGKWTDDKEWTFAKDLSEIDLLFPKGEICNESTKENYQVLLKVKCNTNQNVLKVLNDGTFNENSCKNTIIVETKEGKI